MLRQRSFVAMRHASCMMQQHFTGDIDDRLFMHQLRHNCHAVQVKTVLRANKHQPFEGSIKPRQLTGNGLGKRCSKIAIGNLVTVLLCRVIFLRLTYDSVWQLIRVWQSRVVFAHAQSPVIRVSLFLQLSLSTASSRLPSKDSAHIGLVLGYCERVSAAWKKAM